MKITRRQLRQIIKEELHRLVESPTSCDADAIARTMLGDMNKVTTIPGPQSDFVPHIHHGGYETVRDFDKGLALDNAFGMMSACDVWDWPEGVDPNYPTAEEKIAHYTMQYELFEYLAREIGSWKPKYPGMIPNLIYSASDRIKLNAANPQFNGDGYDDIRDRIIHQLEVNILGGENKINGVIKPLLGL
jgi:hypothetical protein